jgi:cell shape-determining protein MreC
MKNTKKVKKTKVQAKTNVATVATDYSESLLLETNHLRNENEQLKNDLSLTRIALDAERVMSESLSIKLGQLGTELNIALNRCERYRKELTKPWYKKLF